jgi:nucleotide-binding universal stress UspA family protein
MKILVGVDGSSHSLDAVAEIARRPWPKSSQVRVVSAVEPRVVATGGPWVVPPEYFAQAEKAARHAAQAAVDDALTVLRASNDKTIEVSGEVLEGPPKRVILEEADRWTADLIVLGSHGKGAFERLLLGSVSQAIAAHAKCSVEIVRAHRPA